MPKSKGQDGVTPQSKSPTLKSSQDKSFDAEMYARSLFIGGVIGWLVKHSHMTDMSQEMATFIGIVAGAVYDLVAYKVKTQLIPWLKSLWFNND